MFCKNCGSEIKGDETFCPNCGTQINGNGSAQVKTDTPSTKNGNTLSTIAKVFMVIGTVGTALVSLIYSLAFLLLTPWVSIFCFIPLCWCIPMTVHYFRCINERRYVSTAFKVCSLLFVNLIAGILMLCDNEN